MVVTRDDDGDAHHATSFSILFIFCPWFGLGFLTGVHDARCNGRASEFCIVLLLWRGVGGWDWFHRIPVGRNRDVRSDKRDAFVTDQCVQ